MPNHAQQEAQILDAAASTLTASTRSPALQALSDDALSDAIDALRTRLAEASAEAAPFLKAALRRAGTERRRRAKAGGSGPEGEIEGTSPDKPAGVAKPATGGRANAKRVPAVRRAATSRAAKGPEAPDPRSATKPRSAPKPRATTSPRPTAASRAPAPTSLAGTPGTEAPVPEGLEAPAAEALSKKDRKAAAKAEKKAASKALKAASLPSDADVATDGKAKAAKKGKGGKKGKAGAKADGDDSAGGAKKARKAKGDKAAKKAGKAARKAAKAAAGKNPASDPSETSGA